MFNSMNKNYFEKNFVIVITFLLFHRVTVFKIKVNNEKIKKLLSSGRIRKTIKEQELKIIKNRKGLDKDILKGIRDIKIDIEEMDLRVFVGTENASITAFIIPILSTVLATILSKSIKKYNNKQIFSITPVYINENLINIEFSGIFQIKMIHIINTICRVNKKRKGDKNERTSNRRAYDYGYE